MSSILTVQSSDGEHGKNCRHGASSPHGETVGKNSFPKAKARTSFNTPPTSPSNNSKDGSRNNHKNSPWRNTMQRLRRRSTKPNDKESPEKQEQAKHRSTTSLVTTTLPSTDAAVVRVPMRNRAAASPQQQQQQQQQHETNYHNPNPPPSLQYTHHTQTITTTTTNLYPSLNPSFSPTALDRLIVQGTTATASPSLSYGQSNLRNVNDHHGRNSIGHAAGAAADDNVVVTTTLPRDCVAVLRGNGVVAFATVRTKSIIKHSSNEDGETKEGDGQCTTMFSDHTNVKTTTPRKSVSFDEASLAAQARDSRSTKQRQRPSFWDNVMLAMPVILPYLIAILILILSSLVPPADPQAGAISRRNNNNNNMQPSSSEGPVHQRGGGGVGLARIFWYTKEPTPPMHSWPENDQKDTSSRAWADMWQNMIPHVTTKDARIPTSIKQEEEEEEKEQATPRTKGSGVWNFISFQVSTKSKTKQEPKPKTSTSTTTRNSNPGSKESEIMQQPRKNPIAVLWRRYFGKATHPNKK